MKQKMYSTARVARNRTKSQGVGTNTCRVTSTRTVTMPSANASGEQRLLLTLDPLSPFIVNPVVVGIAGAYEFYRLISVKMETIPTAGFTQPGSIQSAYVTSPELMTAYLLGSDGVKDTIIDRAQNVQTRPICESYTHNMSSSRVQGRKWFSCNQTLSTTIDDYDRSMAGAVLLKTRGTTASAATPISYLFTIVYELTGLGNTLGATLMTSSLDPYPVIYNEEEYPKQVMLRARGKPDVKYLRDETKPVD